MSGRIKDQLKYADEVKEILNKDTTALKFTVPRRLLETLLAALDKAEKGPIHLGFFYNETEGITTIYVLDKDGNETDREVKAECLLKRISKYFNAAKKAESALQSERERADKLEKACEEFEQKASQYYSILQQQISLPQARLKKVEELYNDYIDLLDEELSELVPLAHVHGWRSTRHEKGKALREKIQALKSATT